MLFLNPIGPLTLSDSVFQFSQFSFWPSWTRRRQSTLKESLSLYLSFVVIAILRLSQAAFYEAITRLHLTGENIAESLTAKRVPPPGSVSLILHSLQILGGVAKVPLKLSSIKKVQPQQAIF